MSLVLIVQGLVFADGGLSALGLNILNMAFVTSLGGFAIFKGLRRLMPATRPSVIIASGIAGFFAVVLASIAFWLEYAIGGSTNVPLGTVFTAMVGTHALIGIGEGLITGLTVGAVLSVRPDLVFGAKDLMPTLTVSPSTASTGGNG